MLLALVILRSFLLTPGLPIHGDLQFSITIGVERVPYSWSYLLSIPSIVWPAALTFWLSWLCPNSEVFARAIYFLSFTLIAFNMFLVTYTLARKKTNQLSSYVASFIASLIYTLSLIVIGNIAWYVELYAYAFMPLVFYFALQAANGKSLAESIKYSLICSLIFIPIFTSPYDVLVGFVLVISLFAIEFLLNLSRKFFKILPRLLVPLFIIIVFSLLLNAFILLPSFKLGETPLPWSPLLLSQLYGIGKANISIFNAFRLWKWNIETPFTPNLMQLSTLILPCIAWFSVLLLKDKKMATRLALLSVISLFLAKGVNTPLGGAYIWLVYNTPFNLFQRSDIWLELLTLSYALLCSLLIAENLKLNLNQLRKSSLSLFHRFSSLSLNLRSLRNKLAVIIVIVLVLSTLITAQQLLTGNVSGLLAPSPVPNSYNQVNNWFLGQNEAFRTLWLPEYGGLDWMSNPYGVTPESVADWASSMPILTTSNPEQELFANLVLNNLSVNNTFEELSGLDSVKYVILHNDTLNAGGVNELLEEVQNNNLTETYSDGPLQIFYNSEFQPYIHSLQNPIILTVGGLNFLISYEDIPGLNLPESPIVFAEQQLGLGAQILNNLTEGDVIVLYGTGFNDLLFSCLNPNYIYAPAANLNQNLGWSANTGMWNYNFDLDYGKGVIFSSSEGQEFNMNVEVNSTANYQYWIRAYEGNTPGNVSLNVDREKIGTVQIPSSSKGQFNWINCGDLNLTQGEHKLTITNAGASVTLNLVALVPTSEFDQTTNWVNNQISTNHVNIIQISALSDSGWATTSIPSQLWNESNQLLINNCQSPENWSTTSMSVSTTTDSPIEGSSSLLLERTPGGGTESSAVYNPGGTWNLTGKDSLSFWIKFTSSYPTISNVTVSLVDTDGNAKQWSVGDLISSNWQLITLNLNNANYNNTEFNLSQVAKLQINLNSGSNDNSSKILIDSITASNINELLSNTFSSVSEPSPIVNFTRLGSGADGDEWVVTINATKPFILTFSETYSDLWSANIKGVQLEHFPLYYQLNGFLVNQTGVLTVKIDYGLSKSLYTGAIISGITVISIIVIFILIKYKIPKRLRNRR